MIIPLNLRKHLIEIGLDTNRYSCAIGLDEGYRPDKRRTDLTESIGNHKPHHIEEYREWSLLLYEKDINNDGEIDLLDHKIISEIYNATLDSISKKWKSFERSYDLETGNANEWGWIA